MHGCAGGFRGRDLGCAVGKFEWGVGTRDYLGVLMGWRCSMDRYGRGKVGAKWKWLDGMITAPQEDIRL
jgi:hypothetical protein